MPLFWSPPDVERLKAKGNIKGLIKALRYKKESIREAAAEALGQLRARRAVTPLITTFRGAEEYYNVRQAAAIVLSQIGGPQAIGGLIAALQGATITVIGLDAINGSPILDLKPYKPIFDAPPVHPLERTP